MAAVQRSKILLLPVHLHGGTKYIRSLHNNAAIENGYTVSKRRQDLQNLRRRLLFRPHDI